MDRKRVVILISGRGSNMAALVEAAHDRDYPAEIVGVISDKADAAGLDYARRRNIATKVVARDAYADKAAMDAATDAALKEMKADIVCLAGYMRLLSPGFTQAWEGRMINIHPSLLPLFKGLDTHRKALDAGMKLAGCTVHFVTAEMDAGPIIAQAAVPVSADDSETALAQRVLKAEHRLYPIALKMVAEGKVRMEGGKAIFTPFPNRPVADNHMIVNPEPDADGMDLESLARFTP